MKYLVIIVAILLTMLLISNYITIKNSNANYSNLLEEVKTLKSQRDSLFNNRVSLISSIDSLNRKLDYLSSLPKADLDSLSDDEVISKAKEISQDTTGNIIPVHRGTLQYLVETAINYDSLKSQFELSRKLNQRYYATLLLDQEIFMNYEKESAANRFVINKQESEINTLQKKNNRLKTALIAVVAASITYGIVK